MTQKKSYETLLKRLRSEKFTSASDFARATGANRRTVSAHESGTRKIDAKAAQLYAKSLGLDDWRQLITGETKNLEVFVNAHPTEVDLIMAITAAIVSVSPSFSSEKRKSLLKKIAGKEDLILKYKNGHLCIDEIKREIINLVIKK
ncbi:hypothetical protein GTG28_20035 [Vibrio sp. OCN044]|uniref:HTH cro/C1-type domain-containing protein n=1 Tax=Vibrio tetraodonis subsp. pristinus TaxID=2695891 RepID=A0A6L8LZF2_9VIBR|nr:helix-turn-helix transcriptional regulator [Vibrio tetraodonis]MYM61501.1 hypothetical protein [Vibrio tetraodonis subsp. pristinus]